MERAEPLARVFFFLVSKLQYFLSLFKRIINSLLLGNLYPCFKMENDSEATNYTVYDLVR